MMSTEHIVALAEDAGVRAKELGLQPFSVGEWWNKETKRGGWTLVRLRMPNLGDYCPTGWKEVYRIMVNSIDCDTAGEAALTQGQFLARIKPGFGYAIVGNGQFQVTVGEFIRTNPVQELLVGVPEDGDDLDTYDSDDLNNPDESVRP